MKIEICNFDIEPFDAEIKGSLYGEKNWNYKLDEFLGLLYAFRKRQKKEEGKKFILRIGK